MTNLTSAELTAIREQLNQEQNLVAKYHACAKQTQDEALKKKFESIADKHQKHFDTLFAMLG